MYISVIILPLLSAIISGFFGRLFGQRGVIILANFFIVFSCFIAWFIFYEVNLCSTTVSIYLWEWFSSDKLSLHWSFLFDALTTIMLIVILSISSLVHLYSVSYMRQDPYLIRFLAYLSLFTFFMLLMVTSQNFVQLFFGWEGVGVSSYLLINFWFTRIAANQSALKAIIVNRFGDVGILLGILLIFQTVQSLDFITVFTIIPYIKLDTILVGVAEFNAITCISLVLFFGAVGKSAQFGLHTWLPDAMEGPTPVSALIHAATMVTAGVFVLIRISPILDQSQTALSIIAIIGALTAFFAGTIGIYQNDLKRVIAYSTCSQLGYMVASCGLANYSVALFHLMNHAFFKALLFLSAGVIIHAIMDEQDMRKMGGLLELLPFTYILMVIGSAALMALPFTPADYSKELIIELAFSDWHIHSLFIYWLLLLAACCTSIYSITLLENVFLNITNLPKYYFEQIHDASLLMIIPLFILGIASIFVGYIFKDLFIGIGTESFQDSISNYNNIIFLSIVAAEFLNIIIKCIPLFFGIFLIIFDFVDYDDSVTNFEIDGFEEENSEEEFEEFFTQKWDFDLLYNYFIVNPLITLGYNITGLLIDRGLLEFIGPTGLVRVIVEKKNLFLTIASGYIYRYVFWMIISIFYIFFIIKFSFNKEYIIILYIYITIYIYINKSIKKL